MSKLVKEMTREELEQALHLANRENCYLRQQVSQLGAAVRLLASTPVVSS